MKKKAIKAVSTSCIIVSAAWLYADFGYEPLLALLGSIAAFFSPEIETELKKTKQNPVTSQDLNRAGPESIDVDRLVTALNSTHCNDRIKVTKTIIKKLNAISAKELTKVIDLFYYNDRLEAIILLSKVLRKPIEAKELEKILDLIYVNDRPKAIPHLN